MNWFDKQSGVTGVRSRLNSAFTMFDEEFGILAKYVEFYGNNHNGSLEGMDCDERGRKYLYQRKKWLKNSIDACKEACLAYRDYRKGITHETVF